MKVLVTGADGHLGFNLVHALRASGHVVRGSVRGLADPRKRARLGLLGGIELVEADLSDAQSLRAAIDGVDAVCHTAAVYKLFAPGEHDAILRASVAGIETVMAAARDARVGKIVLTSSVVALPLATPGGEPVTEQHWASDLAVPYIRAKTLGEQRAWELAKAYGLNLVTVLPGSFAGPGFIRNTPTIDLIEAIMKGSLGIAAPPFNLPYCDVRDIATAHVLALEKDCTGRFAAVNVPSPSFVEIARAMREIDAGIRVPKFVLPAVVMPAVSWLDALNSLMISGPRTLTPELAATMRGKLFNVSTARIRDVLGWEPRVPMRQSLADTMSAISARAAAA